jgi:hypothetical protein
MAVETLRGNIDIFRDYFIDGPGTAEEQIDHFGTLLLFCHRLIMTTTSSTPYDMNMGVCLIRRK